MLEARVEARPWGCPEEWSWPFRRLRKRPALQIRLAIAFGGGHVYIIGHGESP